MELPSIHFIWIHVHELRLRSLGPRRRHKLDGAPELYNERVEDFIKEMKFENDNMVIVDRGRTVDERCAVLIENGIYKGYCFYDLNYQINNIEILKNIIIPMQNNRDTRTIIQGYLKRNKVIKIVKF